MFREPLLTGRAFLVVEDEYLVALHLSREIEDAGARVVGPISGIDDALRLLEEGAGDLDAALVDVNLHGAMSYAVADRLVELGLPFAFLTGYDCRSIPSRFGGVPCFTKPCRDRELLAFLAALPSGEPRDEERAE